LAPLRAKLSRAHPRCHWKGLFQGNQVMADSGRLEKRVRERLTAWIGWAWG